MVEKITEIIGLRIQAKRERLIGHFGNPIFLVTMKLQGRMAREAFQNVVEKLSEEERAQVLSSLFKDGEGRIHLRFDKQELMRGRLTFSNKDPVKLVYKPPKWEGLPV